MHRRGLLALLIGGASAGCLTEYAPSGPRNPPKGDDSEPNNGGDADGEDDAGLTVREWDFFEGEDGDLVVEVVVATDSDGDYSGTLTVSVRTDHHDETREAAVQLSTGEEETVEFDFDVPFETFSANGSIDLDLS